MWACSCDLSKPAATAVSEALEYSTGQDGLLFPSYEPLEWSRAAITRQLLLLQVSGVNGCFEKLWLTWKRFHGFSH